MAIKQPYKTEVSLPTKEWSAGVLAAVGTLTFSKSKNQVLPAFVAKLGVEKRGLLIAATFGAGLRNKVYLYRPKNIKSGPEAILIIRDVNQLKNKIIPLLASGLFVGKHTKLQNWLEKVKKDKRVPERYKVLYNLWNSKFYQWTRPF